MKKNILTVLLLIIGMNVMAQSVYDGKREAIRNGSGTESDPFLIENAQNLAWLQYLVNMDYSHETEGKYYLLTTDIDLNGSEDFQWEPIGYGLGRRNFDGKRLMFKGVFDGGYHKITNLYINQEKESLAFFEKISSTVKNLYIEGYVYGKTAAGLVGSMEGNDARIEMCVVNVDVESNNSAAGVVNSINRGTVAKTVNTGNIKGNNAGGIAYYLNGTIENCFNTGLIENYDNEGLTGGIVAGNTRSSKVVNCYNVGTIIGENDLSTGGISGYSINDVQPDNCYYLNTSISNPNEYGIAMNAEDMRGIEFVNTLNRDGLVWAMDTENVNDGYPIFCENLWDVNENLAENEVVIYPNPASEYVCFSENAVSCEVFDIVGNKTFSAQYNSSEMNKIDVNNWKSGVYFVRLKMKNGNLIINKLIVQ